MQALVDGDEPLSCPPPGGRLRNTVGLAASLGGDTASRLALCPRNLRVFKERGGSCRKARRRLLPVSIRIRLIEDEVLVVQADPKEWSRAYKNALEDDGMIHIHGSSGRTLAVNPRQILYWEEVPATPPNGNGHEATEAAQESAASGAVAV
jgi:hypothetical protein